MSGPLPDEACEFLRAGHFAHLATLLADGSPSSACVWVDCQDGLVLVNTPADSAKARNAGRDPRVALTVHDRDNPYRMLAIRGRVVAIETEGAQEHRDLLGKRYLGRDTYPTAPGRPNVILRIQADHVRSSL
ncbi:MAG TPA: PPOX class F420-dependent oxidoreductase [Candidatus Dormibacteraeota bacterium]